MTEILPDLSAKSLFSENDWLNETPQATSIFYGGTAPKTLSSGQIVNIVGVGNSNMLIDGENKRIIINDGTNDRIILGFYSGLF